MPPFTFTTKALRSLITNRNTANCLIRSSEHYTHKVNNQIRCYSSSIIGVPTSSAREIIDTKYNYNNNNNNITYYTLGSSLHSKTHKRQFLGCGDGEEGGVLSKVYEERRVLGYSPEQLFDVVAAVDLYHGFVPWCQRSDVIRQHPNGSFDAELEIGFKFLVESYVSHVELNRPKFIKTTVSESSLFDHLINIWEFNPGPVEGTCDLYFFVDFKFQSPLYRQVASVFFKEVVSRLVGSFTERCRLIYGPEIPVLENSYGQKV